ncbi:MAG: hypothetical protein ACP5QZ_02810 [Candidatus Sumerlaeaceae bacterium]
MTAQQIGGLWIIALGLFVFASSFALRRTAANGDGVLALVGSPLLTWLTRVLSVLLWGLGAATYYR